jgi:hypothetical protein
MHLTTCSYLLVVSFGSQRPSFLLFLVKAMAAPRFHESFIPRAFCLPHWNFCGVA